QHRQRLGARLYHADRDHCPGEPVDPGAQRVEGRESLEEQTMATTEASIQEARESRPQAAPVARGEQRGILRWVGEVLYWLAVGGAFVFFLFPLSWMLIPSIKQRWEVTLLPPRYFPFLDFQPVLDNYQSVFTKASELGTITASASERATEISDFPGRLLNSVLIGGAATILAVFLGTLAAYTFSRFRIPGEGDLLFFILSTRMLPAIVVLIPIFLMFTQPFGFLAGVPVLGGLSQVSLRESYVGIT